MTASCQVVDFGGVKSCVLFLYFSDNKKEVDK